MLWTIFLILLVLWLLGFVSGRHADLYDIGDAATKRAPSGGRQRIDSRRCFDYERMAWRFGIRRVSSRRSGRGRSGRALRAAIRREDARDAQPIARATRPRKSSLLPRERHQTAVSIWNTASGFSRNFTDRTAQSGQPCS